MQRLLTRGQAASLPSNRRTANRPTGGRLARRDRRDGLPSRRRDHGTAHGCALVADGVTGGRRDGTDAPQAAQRARTATERRRTGRSGSRAYWWTACALPGRGRHRRTACLSLAPSEAERRRRTGRRRERWTACPSRSAHGTAHGGRLACRLPVEIGTANGCALVADGSGTPTANRPTCGRLACRLPVEIGARDGTGAHGADGVTGGRRDGTDAPQAAQRARTATERRRTGRRGSRAYWWTACALPGRGRRTGRQADGLRVIGVTACHRDGATTARRTACLSLARRDRHGLPVARTWTA